MTWFPRSEKYDSKWVQEHSLGENALHIVESLCNILELRSAQRVLDLGCGKAITSIFLAKEFGVRVWAVDDANSASENADRIEEAGLTGKIVAIEAAADNLPDFVVQFDTIIAIQSYMYFGETETYLPYLLKFLKLGGQIAIADACLTREMFPTEVAAELKNPEASRLFSKMHSINWWKKLWLSSGQVEIERAEYLPESNYILNEYVEKKLDDDPERLMAEQDAVEAIQHDSNNLIALFRLVARKN